MTSNRTFLLLTILILQITNNCNGQNLIIRGIQDVINRITNTTNTLQQAMDNLTNQALNTINTNTEKLRKISKDTQKAIDDLREKFPGAEYTKCFPVELPVDVLEHAIQGLTTCVKRIYETPYNSAMTVLEELNGLMNTMVNLPQQIQKCRRVDIGCYGKFAGEIPTAALRLATIAWTVSSTVVYFEMLPHSFAPCTVLEANYPGLAWEQVTKVSDCIRGVNNTNSL